MPRPPLLLTPRLAAAATELERRMGFNALLVCEMVAAVPWQQRATCG